MKKQIILTLGILILISLIYALPSITEVNTLTGTTPNNSINIQYNFSQDDFLNPSNVKFSWNNTNYSLYDSSLILMFNFDNRSSLGENSTLVYDLSNSKNNGTIFGGNNITFEKGCIHNGCYNFSTGGANNSYINLSWIPISKNNNFTLAFWMNLNDNTTTQVIYSSAISGSDRFALSFTASTDLRVGSYDGSSFQGAKSSSSPYRLDKNTWYFVVYTWNNGTTTGNLSLNNIQQTGSQTPVTSAVVQSTIGSSSSSPPVKFLNGSIDDLKIWNRTLSSDEINFLYYSQLTKYDMQNWSFIKTNNTPITISSQSYYLCSSNSTNDKTCSNIKNIRKLNTIFSNFTISKGNIRNDFYGISDNLRLFRLGGYNIDTNDDGILDTTSNYTWHRQTFLDSKMNTIRLDMALGSYYTNTSDISGVNMSKDLTNITDIVKWAYDNNLKILWNVDYMPTWLADNSTGYCNNLQYCVAINNTKFGNIVVDFINRTSSNGKYLSAISGINFWNEPEGSFFMGNLPADHINKTSYFNDLYNATYIAIKSFNSSLAVGGFSSAEIYTFSNSTMIKSFLSNFSNQMDFFSFNIYKDNLDTWLKNYTLKISDFCTSYGANCSRLIATEINSNSYASSNDSLNNASLKIAPLFIYLLNNNLNVSLNLFHWGDSYKWFDNLNYSIYCSNFPYDYNMVSEPLLNNRLYSSYNITKNFATYCPAGSTVYQSSSDDSTIKTVTCKDNNKYNIIIINTDTNSKNISINTSLMTTTYLMDKDTGTLYLTNSTNNLGISDSYKTNYLINPIFTLTNSIFTKSASTGENYISSEVTLTSSSDKSKTITNNLNYQINSTIIVNLMNGFPCNSLNSINLNKVNVPFTCNDSTKLITIDPILNVGNNQLNLIYTNNPSTNSVCSNLFGGYLSFNPFIVIFSMLALVILVSIIGVIVLVVNHESINLDVNLNFDMSIVKYVFLWVLVIVILLILSLVVIGSLCSFG